MEKKSGEGERGERKERRGGGGGGGRAAVYPREGGELKLASS